MTCFDANRYHLEERTDKSAWAFNIIGTRGPRSICTEAPTAKSGRSSSAISSEHSRPSRHASVAPAASMYAATSADALKPSGANSSLPETTTYGASDGISIGPRTSNKPP